MLKIFRYVLGRQCLFCGKTIDPRRDGVCSECDARLRREDLKIPLEECKTSVALYRYQGPVKTGLHRFKYQGRKELGIVLGRELSRRYRQRGDCAHVITCVPRAKDGRPRMYNQSAVIARQMAKELNLPLDPGLLAKRKGMRSQPECATFLDRWSNAKEAFYAGPSRRDITGLTVLLVDDLITSGATAQICSHVLKERGAKTVLTYTAARTVRNKTQSQFLLLKNSPAVKIWSARTFFGEEKTE